MAITILFTPAGMDAARYHEIHRRLEQQGASSPPGRQLHLCFGSGDQLRVLDVWDSRKASSASARC